MIFFSVLLIILTILALIAVPLAFLIIKYMPFPKDSDTLVFFEDTSKTNGHALCSLVNKRIGKHGRIILDVIPQDSPDTNIISVIIESNKIDVRPKGVWFKNKNVIRVLPNSVEEWFSNEFKKVEISNASTHIESAQREGLERQRSHLKSMAEGEISDMNV